MYSYFQDLLLSLGVVFCCCCFWRMYLFIYFSFPYFLHVIHLFCGWWQHFHTHLSTENMVAVSGLLHEKSSTHHFKENEHVTWATCKLRDPLQKGHPKSAVYCYCWINTLLPLIFIPSTPGTWRDLLPLKLLFPIHMVVGGIELWFFYVVSCR